MAGTPKTPRGRLRAGSVGVFFALAPGRRVPPKVLTSRQHPGDLRADSAALCSKSAHSSKWEAVERSPRIGKVLRWGVKRRYAIRFRNLPRMAQWLGPSR
jgi:hypothetical protein